jgi:hypothetical protein
VLATIVFGSGGRALEVFRLAATPGVDWRSIAASPFTMMNEMGGYTGETILLALGGAAFLAVAARNARRLPPLFFACTLAISVAMFSSDGVAGNHLLDLHIASIVLLVDWAIQAGAQDFVVGASAAVCMVVWLSLMATRASTDTVPVRTQLKEVVRAIGPTDKPILAENALVPIIAGQRPYILDPFSFRVMLEEEPSLGEPMWRMIQERRFAEVVFSHDPRQNEWRDFYAGTHLGQDFMDHLQTSYQFAETRGGDYLYLPRGE